MVKRSQYLAHSNMHFDMNLILVILIGKIQRENRDVKIMPQMNEFKGNYGRKERIGFLTDQKRILYSSRILQNNKPAK